MRASTFRTLAVLIATGIAAAGCDDPATAPPLEARLNTGTAPSVSVTCYDTGNLYSVQRFHCTAQTSGGSTGYNFIWYGNASEYYDYGGMSKAWYPCQYVSGSYGYGYLAVTVTLHDSSGNIVMNNGNPVSASYSRSCGK